MSIRRTCASCGFPIILELGESDPGPANIAMHWRICEPRKNWPDYMSVKRPKPERVARVTLETEDVLRREHVVPEVSLATPHVNVGGLSRQTARTLVLLCVYTHSSPSLMARAQM